MSDNYDFTVSLYLLDFDLILESDDEVYYEVGTGWKCTTFQNAFARISEFLESELESYSDWAFVIKDEFTGKEFIVNLPEGAALKK